MHSIGIIAAKKQGPLVALFDQYINAVGYQYPQIIFTGDGVLVNTPGGPALGVWAIGAPITNIGNNYDARYTLQAGSGPIYAADGLGTAWGKIAKPGYGSSRMVWDMGADGRVLVEIRDASTLAVLTSGRFWSHPSYAP